MSVPQKYIRDGRAPIPKNSVTSKIMSSIRAKNTTPEVILRKQLRAIGLRKYRLHYKGIPGRPDICFMKERTAVFVNGCYWHRCPKCRPSMPKSHVAFWREKFRQNKLRDRRKNAELRKLHWLPITIWECEIKDEPSMCAMKIKSSLTKRR